jgi:hypothetical protein
LLLQDSVVSGTLNGLMQLFTGKITFGNSGQMIWDDIGLNLNLTAGNGPFIQGETWHTISLAAGLTGTLRVKKLPWNAVWMDVQVTVGGAAGTFTCGSLPDATYYPTAAHNFPLAATVAGQMYVHIPASGAVQIITSAGTGGNFPGGSFEYPTN